VLLSYAAVSIHQYNKTHTGQNLMRHQWLYRTETLTPVASAAQFLQTAGAHCSEGSLSLLQPVDGFDKFLGKKESSSSHAAAPSGVQV
jgi:hypothetical protein